MEKKIVESEKLALSLLVEFSKKYHRLNKEKTRTKAQERRLRELAIIRNALFS